MSTPIQVGHPGLVVVSIDANPRRMPREPVPGIHGHRRGNGQWREAAANKALSGRAGLMLAVLALELRFVTESGVDCTDGFSEMGADHGSYSAISTVFVHT